MGGRTEQDGDGERDEGIPAVWGGVPCMEMVALELWRGLGCREAL